MAEGPADARVDALARTLIDAVESGDKAAVVTALDGLPEVVRNGAHERIWPGGGAGPLEHLPLGFRRADRERGVSVGSPARQAAALACLGTVPHARLRFHMSWPLAFDEHTEQVVVDRGRRFATRAARTIVTRRFNDDALGWIRMLMRLGLAERPPDGVYLPWVVSRVLSHALQDIDGLVDLLRAEPDLLDDTWLGLEVVPGTVAAREWSEPALAVLLERGVIDRDRLLAVALRALAGDDGAHGWLGRVIDSLEPTEDEQRAVLAAYLRAVEVPDPAAQKEALARLGRLLDAGVAVAPGDLAGALRTPLLGSPKNLAVGALRLLDRAATEADGLVPALLGVAEALVHPRPDVQERALRTLERRWPDDDAERRLVADAVAGWAPDASATLRPRIDVLLARAAPVGDEPPAGEPPAEEPRADVPAVRDRVAAVPPSVRTALGLDAAVAHAEARRWPPPARFAPDAAPVLRPERRIDPVTDPDELIALWTALLEGEGRAVDLERALDGVTRLGPGLLADDPDRLAPLHRRATSGGGGGLNRTAPVEAALVVQAWIDGPSANASRWLRTMAGPDGSTPRPLRQDERQPVGPDRRGPFTPWAFVELRMLEVRVMLGQRTPRQLLATPTHEGGWIDPRVFRARVQALRDAGIGVARLDLIAALRRVVLAGAGYRWPADQPDEGVAAALRTLDLDDADLASLPKVVDSHGWPRPTPLTVALPDLPPFRRDDPLGMVLHRLAEGAGDRFDRDDNPVFAGVEPLTAEAARWTLPHQPDLAHAAALLMASSDPDELPTWSHADRLVMADPDPDRPLGRLGSIAVAVGLVARAPDLAVTALDLFLAAAEDGRLDADAVGEGWAALHGAGTLRPGRLRDPLAEAARVSPRHAVVVLRSLEAFLRRVPDVPHDVHAPLEVLVEVAATTGCGVADDGARATLERISSSSKGAKRSKLTRVALAAPVDETARDRWRWDAVHAQASRAERWAETMA